jgi:RHS repeat-associated protein
VISGHKIISDGTYALQNYTYNPDTGNLASNSGVSYTYGDNAHKHAVTGTSSGNIYSYDQNGNQTTRRVGGITYTLVYDAENRLVQVKLGRTIQATYSYDGDGNRVKTVVGSTTTTYVGNYLERECINTTCAQKSYYYAARQRVALRKGDGTLYFLLTDHLGSTAITATSGGGFSAELRYYPWGGTRYSSGTTPTSYRYTGQREAEVGLYYYGARYFDPQLGRFISPDSIIPQQQGSQAWDRYAYTNNNPVKFTDPSGHGAYCGDDYDPGCLNDEEYAQYVQMGGEEISQAGEYDEPEQTIIDWIVPDEGTYGVGLTFTGGCVIFITISPIAIYIDPQGNVGVGLAIGGGGLLPAAAEGSAFFTATEAESIDQVRGVSMVLGGSVELEGSVGYEGVFFKDLSTGEKLKGGTVTIGLGIATPPPIPGEGHVGINYTWLPLEFNLYDVFNIDRP